jgi:hypothetical protein
MDQITRELDWQHTDVMSLDVGNVCSDKRVSPHLSVDEPYLTVDPGAFAFMFLFLRRYGRKLKFISRVNHAVTSWKGNGGRVKWHWIVRFVESL